MIVPLVPAVALTDLPFTKTSLIMLNGIWRNPKDRTRPLQDLHATGRTDHIPTPSRGFDIVIDRCVTKAGKANQEQPHEDPVRGRENRSVACVPIKW
jgi:hypothetical protein